MDQYDYIFDEYIYNVSDKYSKLIGSFIIKFSELEHELNTAIADLSFDDCHEPGYLITEKLSVRNKIDLFYRMCIERSVYKGGNSKERLKKIKVWFDSINTFRNNLVHANWLTLKKNGYVRIKFVVDSENGYIKFKSIKITPKIIREKIREIEKRINMIDEYKDDILQL